MKRREVVHVVREDDMTMDFLDDYYPGERVLILGRDASVRELPDHQARFEEIASGYSAVSQ